MIEIVESKDMHEIWKKMEVLIERTKRHTIQIKELQKLIK